MGYVYYPVTHRETWVPFSRFYRLVSLLLLLRRAVIDPEGQVNDSCSRIDLRG